MITQNELRPLPTFRFGGLELRPAGPQDFTLARDWTKADPDHATTPPGFWITQSMKANSYILIDDRGPLFFFKMVIAKRWVEVHIQFSPGNALAQARVRRGLFRGMRWLELELKNAGFDGYYFHSTSMGLIQFAEKHLGFEWDGRQIFKKLKQEETYGEGQRQLHPESDGAHEAQGNSGSIRQSNAS